MASNDPLPRARRARPKTSLKMQAIGFLSRREYSRHELRAKLLDALRKRAHEETQRVQAEGRRAREVADALLATPSNGIDDAFAPPMPLAAPAPNPREEREACASRSTRTVSAPPATAPAMSRGRVEPLLESVRLASGDALTGPLRASLAAAAAVVSAEARTNAGRCARVQHVSAVAGAAHSDPDPGTELETEREPAAVVDELLDWLVANKYLSEERFVESRVNARARKQGTMLIKQELSRHGLALEPQQAAALRETEFARAKALWDRRFGEVGVDARARAKQARFLVSRGFAADLVRRIVGGGGGDDDAF